MINVKYLAFLLFLSRPLFAKGLDALAETPPETPDKVKVVPPQADKKLDAENKVEKAKDDKVVEQKVEQKAEQKPVEEAKPKVDVKSEFAEKFQNKIFLGTGLYFNKVKTPDGETKSDGSADAFFLVDTISNERRSLRLGIRYVPIAVRVLVDDKSYKGTIERFAVPLYFLVKSERISYGLSLEPSYDRIVWINDDKLDIETSKVQYKVGGTIGLGAEFRVNERVYFGPKISKSFGYVDNIQVGISTIFIL